MKNAVGQFSMGIAWIWNTVGTMMIQLFALMTDTVINVKLNTLGLRNINIITEESYTLHEEKVVYTEEKLNEIANVHFALNDIFTRWDCEISQKDISYTKNKNSYIFTADYYCIENIAEPVPIQIVN